MNSDPRCFPLIEIGDAQIGALLRPVISDASIAEISLVAGGLVNTLYHVRLADGRALCLRIFAAGRRAWETEQEILLRVAAALPVPEVLLADGSGDGCPYPYLVYRWIEGITLDDCRKQMPPAALLSLAEPLGRAFAGIAGFRFTKAQPTGSGLSGIDSGTVEPLLQRSVEQLRAGLARARLGATLADALRSSLEASAVQLCALDLVPCLVHGDLGGRNILVAPAGGEAWRVSGLIDWEKAFRGAALWDVGRLFRYARRYSATFCQRFAQSYCAAGATLPTDWWRTARLLDAIRHVEYLNEEQGLPVVFAECRELIEVIVAHG